MPIRDVSQRTFYTLPEAAARIGIGRSTAYLQFHTTGCVHGIKAVHHSGRRYVIPKAALERAIAGETTAPALARLPWDGPAT